MRIRFLLAVVLAAALPWSAAAQENAFTNRATELRERGAADAPALASLPEGTPVKVLARGGGWTRVEAEGRQGWVRVFHLRFPVVAETGTAAAGASVMGAVTSAFGFNRERSREANLATTGVRGLTPEDLKNASPDPEALRRLQSHRADRAGAERFAREGGLAASDVDYGAPK